MYKIVVKGSSYTIPKEKIKALALYEALQRGITSGPIHDEQTAIEFLESLGMTIEELENAMV